MAEDRQFIFNEGGINWAHFTELILHEDYTITILAKYRLHKDSVWPDKCMNAPPHPHYYHHQIWSEDKDRMAYQYWLPPGIIRHLNEQFLTEGGWINIRNKKDIFGFGEG